MNTPKTSAGFLAPIFIVLLTSCSATRHTSPVSSKELMGLVLLIEETADGQATHSWRSVGDFDFSQFHYLSSSNRLSASIVFTAASPRDCHAEFNDCQDNCLERPLAPGYEHVKQGSGAHRRICRDGCWQAYRDCEELQELRGRQTQEFTATDSAIEWLKRNRHAVVVGSGVVIAGVVFVVVSAGAGALMLAPAMLLASSEIIADPRLVTVSP
ncbi:hypothetical protein [Archangium violaceum]|uniref:hypothetical protein n=1 Tax=Archangium violaceum TaxID=83451 RepID=UPI0009498E00|nr:hypothetical protein [Archangium violaceum]